MLKYMWLNREWFSIYLIFLFFIKFLHKIEKSVTLHRVNVNSVAIVVIKSVAKFINIILFAK